MINLYTDASIKNGNGGYAYIIQIGNIVISKKQYIKSQDINYLELLAVVEGLKALCTTRTISVFTDSNYVIGCLRMKLLGHTKKGLLRQQFNDLRKQHSLIFTLVNKENKMHREAHYLAREAANDLN